jgi:hypothetical protein
MVARGDAYQSVHAKIAGMRSPTHALLAVAIVLFFGGGAAGHQNPDRASLPDSPAPKQDQDMSAHKEQKNIWQSPIGLVTRKSYFYPELAATKGPLSSTQKFELFLDKSISPPQILSSAAGAGISEARGTFAGYGQGGEGFGKRFGASMASGASSHFFGTFLLPAILHDDPRYFVRLNGGFKLRAAHALRRMFVIPTDAGNEHFNWPGTLGPMAAEGLANTYLPESERTVRKTFERYGVRVGFGAVNNLLKEYWPTIFKNLRIAKVAPGLQP